MQNSASPLKASAHKLSKLALNELMTLFGPAIDPSMLATPKSCRERVFTPALTFWAFVSQCLIPHGSCRYAVLKIQSLLLLLKQSPISSHTGGYCQARARLSMDLLAGVSKSIINCLGSKIKTEHLWLKRHVKVVDSTSVSLPDTSSNQKAWPQSTSQKRGCGFPVMKICGLFSLATGSLLSCIQSPLSTHDCRLFKKLWHLLATGDVVLADRAFCSYLCIASLKKRSVDCVFRLHQRRHTDFRKGKRLGKNDHLVIWKKPAQRTATMSKKEFDSLPKELLLRELKFCIAVPGFRTHVVFLVTTLLDPAEYPLSSLAELFRKRWSIELCFREIKTSMRMEELGAKSPSMALKELAVFLITYNLIRLLMFEAARKQSIPISNLSFKGTVDLLISCSWLFRLRISKKRLRSSLLDLIASDQLPCRPDRSEPRVQKRRPKPYQYLTTPRRQMIVIPHRDKYRKKP